VPDYGAVPVDVLVVGPPALPAVAVSAIATPPNATADKIDIALVFQYWASRTPAGFPGAKAEESASALVVQSANDIATQRAIFISRFPSSNPVMG
jgi:hypothetical protein